MWARQGSRLRAAVLGCVPARLLAACGIRWKPADAAPTHRFGRSGSQTVKLTVVNEAGAAIRPGTGVCWPVFAHEEDEPHFHEWSEQARGALADIIWKAENLELTTVGIDIGSSTSHLMFSRVRLQRKTQLLSSEFVVVARETLWRSPILLTPFASDNSIDADRLRAFVDDAYRCSGITPAQVDSGAVILTGEAIKRSNAKAIEASRSTHACVRSPTASRRRSGSSLACRSS